MKLTFISAAGVWWLVVPFGATAFIHGEMTAVLSPLSCIVIDKVNLRVVVNVAGTSRTPSIAVLTCMCSPRLDIVHVVKFMSHFQIGQIVIFSCFIPQKISPYSCVLGRGTIPTPSTPKPSQSLLPSHIQSTSLPQDVSTSSSIHWLSLHPCHSLLLKCQLGIVSFVSVHPKHDECGTLITYRIKSK